MTEGELKEALEHDALRRELERKAFTDRIDKTVAVAMETILKSHTAELVKAGQEESERARVTAEADRAADLARRELELRRSHRLGVASQLLSVVTTIPTEPEAMRRQARAALAMADVLLDEVKR